MEHPAITRINRTGDHRARKIYGTDVNGNLVYSGDEILCLGGDFYLKIMLSPKEKRELFDKGATHFIAE